MEKKGCYLQTTYVRHITCTGHIVTKFGNNIIISYNDVKLPFIFDYTNEGGEGHG
jgi:hypothetical protein